MIGRSRVESERSINAATVNRLNLLCTNRSILILRTNLDESIRRRLSKCVRQCPGDKQHLRGRCFFTRHHTLLATLAMQGERQERDAQEGETAAKRLIHECDQEHAGPSNGKLVSIRYQEVPPHSRAPRWTRRPGSASGIPPATLFPCRAVAPPPCPGIVCIRHTQDAP